MLNISTNTALTLFNFAGMITDAWAFPSPQLMDLCEQFALSSDDINQFISDEDILDLYSHLKNLEEVAYHLGLSHAEFEVIEGKVMYENKNLIKLYMLQRWKSKALTTYEGPAYAILLEALLKAGNSESAKLLCSKSFVMLLFKCVITV